MFAYVLRRLAVAIRERWYWLLLAPLALGVYFVSVYLAPRYQVTVRVVATAETRGSQWRESSQSLLERTGISPAGPQGGVRTSVERLLFQSIPSAAKMGELGVAVEGIDSSPDWRVSRPMRQLVRYLELVSDDQGYVLRYRGPDRAVGERLMAFLAPQLANRVGKMLPLNPDGTVKLTVSPAQVENLSNRLPDGAGPRGILVFALGLLVGLLLVLAGEAFGRTLSTEKELSLYLEVPVLGNMPRRTDSRPAARSAE